MKTLEIRMSATVVVEDSALQNMDDEPNDPKMLLWISSNIESGIRRSLYQANTPLLIEKLEVKVS